MTDEKKPIDWAGIEKDYRAGTRSIREIAGWFSISDTAIRKRAAAKGWTRASEPTGSQSSEAQPVQTIVPPKPEVSRIEEVIGHGRNLAERLLDELSAETLHKGEMELIIQMNETDPARLQALRQAVSLPARAKTLQTIALALKTMGETAAPEGKKAQRKSAAEASTAPGGKFAPRPGPPQLVVSNK